MTVQAVPKGFGVAGRSLWARINGSFELREDEVAVLEAACRTADTIERLDEELKSAPLTVKGSVGQMREHPLLAEARQQRALLARLLAQLKLPDSEELGAYRSGQRTSHARHAAQARWSAHGA